MFTAELEPVDWIATHAGADLDALASLAGARLLWPRARVLSPTRWLPGADRAASEYAEWLGLDSGLPTLDPAPRHALLVDVQDPARTDLPAGWVRDPGLTWTVVDHHPPGPTPATETHRWIEAVGACATLMTEWLEARDIVPSGHIATLMLAGILADTGRMSHPGTTARDLRAAARLLDHGADLTRAHGYLAIDLPERQRADLARLAAARQQLRGSTPTCWRIQVQAEAEIPGLATLVATLLDEHPVDLAVCIVCSPGRTRLVARTRLDWLDLRTGLAAFGAQGHASAVTAVVEDSDAPDEVAASMAEVCDAFLGPERRARDVMSQPVHSVDLEASLESAWQLARLWSLTVVPVTRNGRPQGVLHRRELDRAIQHGLASAPIRKILPRRVVQVPPGVTIAEIEDEMLRHRVGRVLVVDEHRLVGICSRTDLERSRAEVRLTPSPDETLLRPDWPGALKVQLDRVLEAAGDRPLYLVGGGVRDLLLGRSLDDLDLVVEEDAIALARSLATDLGARIHVHEAFGTARLEFPDGTHLDLASARIEHYPRAGGLPEVQRSRLRDDLRRRDFTVNAMALRLQAGREPVLVDPHRGRDDLARRCLRTLHPVSFFEDPVRIFRGIRFAHRFGFHFEADTASQAREAIASGRHDGMGGERLKLELRQGARLPDTSLLHARLAELDAWRLLAPDVRWDVTHRRAGRWLDRAVRKGLLEPDDRLWTLLGLLVASAPVGRREPILETLLPTRTERRTALDAAATRETMQGWSDVWPGWDDAHRARAVDGLSAHGRLVAFACGPRPIRRWLLERWPGLARRRPVRVDGHWLKLAGLAPGPRFRELLDDLQLALWQDPELDEEAWMSQRLAAEPTGV